MILLREERPMHTVTIPPGLIDMVYEAAVAPELWPATLRGIAVRAGADAALMMQNQPAGLSWEASPEAQEHMAAFVADGWHLRSVRTGRLLKLNHAGFVRDSAVFGPGDLEADPVQRDFLRPRGYGRELGTAVAVPSGDLLVFSVHYPWDNVPVPQQAIEFLDALRPHLARAALLSGRLWMARARSVVQAFQAMGLPAAALSPDGRVIAFNDHFSSDGRIVAAAGNRIGLHDPRAKSLFENGLIQLRVGHPTVLSILLPGHADYETAVLHLIPVRGAGRDVFAGSLTLVVLTAMSPHALPSADLLHALFDLTPAEARLARGLATGQTLSELAHSSAVSRETLRTHLKAVLAKTGMSRQTDLARLLSRLPPEA